VKDGGGSRVSENGTRIMEADSHSQSGSDQKEEDCVLRCLKMSVIVCCSQRLLITDRGGWRREGKQWRMKRYSQKVQ